VETTARNFEDTPTNGTSKMTSASRWAWSVFIFGGIMGLRSFIGNAVDQVGTGLNLPGIGLSEMLAGGKTANTGRINEYSSPMQAFTSSPSVQGVSSSGLRIDSIGGQQQGSNPQQVLGAATTNPQAPTGNGAAAANPAAAQASQLAGLETMGTNSINSEYDIYTQNLERQIGLLPQQRQALEGQINSMFGTNQAELAGQRSAADRQLQTAGETIESRQESSLRDLDSNMRNQQDSFFRRAGAMGAGSSSATDPRGAGAYAFARLGQQQRSQILQQANDLSSQLNQKKLDLQQAYDGELNKLKQWRDSQQSNILSAFQQQENELRNQISGASGERVAQIRQLAMQIRSQAIQALSQADQYVAGVNQNLQRAVQSNQQYLEQQQQRLAQQAQGALNIDPSQISANGFSAGGGLFYGTNPGNAVSMGNGGGYGPAATYAPRRDDRYS
jgi:hypothetical protein